MNTYVLQALILNIISLKAMLKLAQHRHRRRTRHRKLGTSNRSRISKHVCCSGESEEECEAHSGESEEDHECMHHSRQVPHGHSDGSESEVEASESSEEEEQDEEEVLPGQCHQHRLLIAQQREILRRHYQEGHEVETSEEEEEEEDEESEYFDSEDEELLKEARLVHMRHSCHQDSEESSDFDEEAQLQGKMTYQMAEHLLRKHHLQQQQKQMLELAQQAQKRQQTIKIAKTPEKKGSPKPKKEATPKDKVENKSEEGEQEEKNTEKMEVKVCLFLANCYLAHFMYCIIRPIFFSFHPLLYSSKIFLNIQLQNCCKDLKH